MLAGVALQLLTTLVFLVVFGLYFRRLARQYPERRVTRLRSRTGLVLWGTLAMAALIVVRCALPPLLWFGIPGLTASSSFCSSRGGFRTAELSEGLFSSLSRTRELLARLMNDSHGPSDPILRLAEIAIIVLDAVPMILVILLLKCALPAERRGLPSMTKRARRTDWAAAMPAPAARPTRFTPSTRSSSSTALLQSSAGEPIRWRQWTGPTAQTRSLACAHTSSGRRSEGLCAERRDRRGA